MTKKIGLIFALFFLSIILFGLMFLIIKTGDRFLITIASGSLLICIFNLVGTILIEDIED